jgi:ubiquinone/menaquinone biosynthesis C-methylase UbiE
MIEPTNEYTVMQKNIYDDGANKWSPENRDYVVGAFNAHNDHSDYELMFENLPAGDDVVMLDFGCGPGRNLVKYYHRFGRVDGADLSSINLDKARVWLEHEGLDAQRPNLYQVDGISLNSVPSDAYDIVMSTITLQHIAVHDIRYSIMADMFRVLKSGGWVTLQMGFGPDKQDAVDYSENNYEAKTTNGNMDTRVTDSEQLKTDLEEIGFVNFSYILRPVGPGDNHTSWIYFRAQK